MSSKVSTFLDVGGQYPYTFLLVVWNDYKDEVRDELNRQADAFGADLGTSGEFVQAYPQRMYETAREVLDKPWPRDSADRLENDPQPIILILGRDLETFSSFDPREHQYAVVWLSDFRGDPSSLRAILQQLALRTRRGDDVIRYLRDVAIRQAAARKNAKIDDAVVGVAKYIEIKPNLFGVSIDITAILRDLAGYRAQSQRRKADRTSSGS